MSTHSDTMLHLPAASHGEPAVRGYFLRCAAAALEGMRMPTMPDELANALPALRKARGLGWLPIERLLPMVGATHDALGEAGARELVHESMRRAMGAPPWRKLIVAALRSFGLSLQAMTRWVPSLYALVFRDTGTMHIPECDAREAHIEFSAVPAVCLASPAYVTALGHALEYYFELSGHTGSVTLAQSDATAGTLSYVIRVDGPAS